MALLYILHEFRSGIDSVYLGILIIYHAIYLGFLWLHKVYILYIPFLTFLHFLQHLTYLITLLTHHLTYIITVI